LVRLLTIADYLAIDRLILLISSNIAGLIKGKGAKEAAVILGVTNKTTKKEEDLFRFKHKWKK